MTKIETTLVQLICTQLERDDLKNSFPLEEDLTNLGLDSIDAINLILEIENSFDIEFPDTFLNQDTFRSASSLGNAISTIQNEYH